METSGKKEKETPEMLVRIISIPQTVAVAVLERLQSCQLNCQYAGFKTSGQILFRVEYNPWERSFIEKLTNDMRKAEKHLDLLTSIAEELMKNSRKFIRLQYLDKNKIGVAFIK